METETPTIPGLRPGALRGRRPRQATGTRVCELADCDTRLSRYNLGKRCNHHAVRRFPRLRNA